MSPRFLQFVHERVLFVGIQRFVETAEFQQRIPPGHQVAKNQFLFARGARPPDGGITGAAGREREPAREHHGKNPFQKRRVGRTKVRAPDHFYLCITQECPGTAKVARVRNGIVVEKINPIAARGLDGGVALDGRLPAARNDDFEATRRIIQPPRGGHRLDLRLARAGRDDDGDTRQIVAHVKMLEQSRHQLHEFSQSEPAAKSFVQIREIHATFSLSHAKRHFN